MSSIDASVENRDHRASAIESAGPCRGRSHQGPTLSKRGRRQRILVNRDDQASHRLQHAQGVGRSLDRQQGNSLKLSHDTMVEAADRLTNGILLCPDALTLDCGGGGAEEALGDDRHASELDDDAGCSLCLCALHEGWIDKRDLRGAVCRRHSGDKDGQHTE